LRNITQHSGAQVVSVHLEAAPDVTLTIVDDGQGFDPLLLDRTGWPRLGLQTMRERAQAIGGTFEVVSVPGRGTRVAVHVPAANRRERARASAAR
jgi:signal transduction histidine kinase